MINYRDCIHPINPTSKSRVVYTVGPPSIPNTLCWCCRHSNDICSWHAKEHIPVPGWEAVRRDIPIVDNSIRRKVNRKTESYAVLRCPRFSLAPRSADEFRLFDPEEARRIALEKGGVLV